MFHCRNCNQDIPEILTAKIDADREKKYNEKIKQALFKRDILKLIVKENPSLGVEEYTNSNGDFRYRVYQKTFFLRREVTIGFVSSPPTPYIRYTECPACGHKEYIK